MEVSKESNLIMSSQNQTPNEQEINSQETKDIFVKLNTLDVRKVNNNIMRINNNNLNLKEVKKSKTLVEYGNNNIILDNRLETVIESINEISNSKINSSMKSDNNLKNNKLVGKKNNIITGKDGENKNIKNIPNLDTKGIESENNISIVPTELINNTKKSSNFIRSDKTE